MTALKCPARQKALKDKQVTHPYIGYYVNLLGNWMRTYAHIPQAQPLDRSTTRKHVDKCSDGSTRIAQVKDMNWVNIDHMPIPVKGVSNMTWEKKDSGWNH